MELSERKPGESSQAYALRTIKENIINLSLAPGSQISESEIAAELGISRTPVREAIIDLSKVNIIEIYPQKKGLISLIDYDMIDECQFMRSNLEKATMEIVCEKATPEDLARLRENVRLQNFYLAHMDPGIMMQLDKDFHGMLFEIADKMLVYRVMNAVSIHFDRVRNMALTAVKNLKIVHDHEDIVEAIADRDARRACAVLEVHLNRYKADASAIREQYPQYIK